MLLLVNASLFQQQSFGHARDFGVRKEFLQKVIQKNIQEKTKPDIYLEERYHCLKNMDIWE